MDCRGILRNIRRRSDYNLTINLQKVLSCVALACTISLTPVYSQQIITDGNTNTSLNINGSVTDVTTTTTKGSNAFNSFSRFNVNAGNIVNLVVPEASENLINLVNSEQSQINGVLNSIKAGQVGGNVFLVNPHGIVVGSEGVINVGSLTAVTPTVDFANNFFNAPGDPADASITAVINGTAPINSSAVINMSGEINAITNVKLDGGNVNVEGDIYTSAQFKNSLNTSDFVNLNSVEYTENNDPLELVLEGGNVIIKAQGNLYQDGLILAGKNVQMSANNIEIGDTSFIHNGKEVSIGALTEIDFNGIIDSYGNVFVESLTDCVYLNEGSLIRTTGEINADAATIVSIDGLLETRSGYAYLKVLENNTLDPNSNIGATIIDGNIIVDSVSTYDFAGHDININGTLVGYGSLNALYGPGEIHIINESNNNLVTDQLIADGGGLEGKIYINGTEQTSNYVNAGANINVTIGGENTNPSEIIIENKTLTDIIIDEIVLSNNGLIDFYNAGGNIIVDSQNLIANKIYMEASNAFNLSSDSSDNFQYISILNSNLNASDEIEFLTDGLIISGSDLRITEGGIDINTSFGTALLPDISFYNYDISPETIISGQIFEDIALHADEFPDPMELRRTWFEINGDINVNSGIFFVDLFSSIQSKEGNFSAEGEIILIGGLANYLIKGDIDLLALNNDARGTVMTFGMDSLADIATIFTDPLNHRANFDDIMGFMYIPLFQSEGSITIAAPINSGIEPPEGVEPENVRTIFNNNFDDMGLIILSNSHFFIFDDVYIAADATALLDTSIETVNGDIDIDSLYGVALLPEIGLLPDYFTDNSINFDFTYVRNYLDRVTSIFEQYGNIETVPGVYLRSPGDINIDQGMVFTSSYSVINAGNDFSTSCILANFIGYNDIDVGRDFNVYAINDDNVGAIFMLGLEELMTTYGRNYTSSPSFESITVLVAPGEINLISLDPDQVAINAQNHTLDNVFDYLKDDLTQGHIVGMLESSFYSSGGVTITSDLTALVGASIFNDNLYPTGGSITVASSLGTVLLPDFIPLFTYFLNPENASQIEFPDILSPVYYKPSMIVNAGNNVDIFSGILYAQLFSHAEASGTLTSDSVVSVVAGGGLLIGWEGINFNALNSEDTGVILITTIEPFLDVASDYLQEYGITFGQPLKSGLMLIPEVFCFEDININAGTFNGDIKDETDPLKDLHFVGIANHTITAEYGDINITGDIIGIIGTKVQTKYGSINLLSSTSTILIPDIMPLLSNLIDKETILSGDISLSDDTIKLFTPEAIDPELPPIIIDFEDLQNMVPTTLSAGNNINVQSGILFVDLFGDLIAQNSITTDSVFTTIVGDMQISGCEGDVSIRAINNPENGIILLAGLTELIGGLDLYLAGHEIETNLDIIDYFALTPLLIAGQSANIQSLTKIINYEYPSIPDISGFTFNDNDIPDVHYTLVVDFDVYGVYDVNISGDIIGISSSLISSAENDIHFDSSYATILLPGYIPLFEYINNDGKPISGDLIIVDGIVPPEIMVLTYDLRTEIKSPVDININTGLLYAQLFSDLEAGENVNINSTVTVLAGDAKISAMNDINVNASNDSEIGAVLLVGTESIINLENIQNNNDNPAIAIPDDLLFDMMPKFNAGHNINIKTLPPSTPANISSEDEFGFLDELPDGHYVAILDYDMYAGGNINITADNFIGITGSFITSDFGNISINSNTGVALLPSYTLFMSDAMQSEIPVSENIFLSKTIVNNQPVLSELIGKDLPIISLFHSEDITENDLSQIYDVVQIKTSLYTYGKITINSGIKYINLFSDIFAGESYTSNSVITMIGGDASIISQGNVTINATNHPQVGEITLIGYQYLIDTSEDTFPYFTPMIMADGSININATRTKEAILPLANNGDEDDIFDITLPEDSLVGLIGYNLYARGDINLSGDYVAILDSELMSDTSIKIDTAIGTIISPYYDQYQQEDGNMSAIFMDMGPDNRSTLMAGEDIIINAGGVFALFNSDIATGDDFISNSVLTTFIGNPQIMIGDDIIINACNNDEIGGIFIIGTEDFDLFDFDFDDIPFIIAEDNIDLNAMKGSSLFPNLGLIDSPGFSFYMNLMPSGLHVVGIFDSFVFAGDDLDINADFEIISDSFVESGSNIIMSLVIGILLLPDDIMMAAMFLPFDPIYPDIDMGMDLFNEPADDPFGLPGNSVISGSSINAQSGDLIINSGGTIANVFGVMNGGNSVQLNSTGNTMMLGNTTTSAGSSINVTTNKIKFGSFADTAGLLSSVGFAGEISNYVQPDKLALINSLPNETHLNATSTSTIQVNSGGISGGTIKSASGDLIINSPGGNVAMDYISTPGTSQVISGGNSISITEIDPTIIDLRVLGSGGTIYVSSGVASQAVNLTGDNIIANFNDENTSDPLIFNVTGTNGPASNVSIKAGSSQGLIFNSLNSNNATINNTLQNTALTLNNTTISNQAYFYSDTIVATNNINLNNVSLLGYYGSSANSITILNTGNLNVTELISNNAIISTTGPNLNIDNAIITGTGSFSNNAYTAVYSNTGRVNLNGADLVLSSNGSFMLNLNSSDDIVTDASILAAKPYLDLIGSFDRPEINNDINQTTRTAEDKINDILNNNSKNDNESNLFKNKDLLEIDGSSLYKDSYVVEILNEALEAYRNAINNNETEEEALKKAADVLKKANFDHLIVKQLLKYNSIKANSDIVKILNNYSSKKST